MRKLKLPTFNISVSMTFPQWLDYQCWRTGMSRARLARKAKIKMSRLNVIYNDFARCTFSELGAIGFACGVRFDMKRGVK